MVSGQVAVVCLIDPGAFRTMHAFVQGSCDGMGRLDVVSLAATEEVPAAAQQQQQQPEPQPPRQEQPGEATLRQPDRLVYRAACKVPRARAQCVCPSFCHAN